MKLYTAQMGRWREAKKHGIPFIDITVKSGMKEFAPTWDLLSRSKAGSCSNDQYTGEFIILMRKSYRDNPEVWNDMISKDEVCIACYCGKGKFCHRLLLVDILEKVCKSKGVEFTYEGEL